MRNWLASIFLIFVGIGGEGWDRMAQCPSVSHHAIRCRYHVQPGVCVGSTCKHHACCWKILWSIVFLLLSRESGSTISRPRVESSIPEMGMVAREAKNLLFSQSKDWYSVCPMIIAIPHTQNWI